ncbi:MAG: ABC transporter ATP-binding protein/permease [Desulfobacterales bacterium]|nr:ABC transporter ATP-binding protein/permease [Pseudomonadota bacterium]MCG2773418.1 ABC transporter ATP-binding protein/permease [Desulfobacterales bacterium]
MRSWIIGIISRYRFSLTLLVMVQLGCGVLIALQPRYYQQLVSLAINGQYANLWSSGQPLLEQLALIFLGIAVLQGISGYAGSVFSFNLLKQLQTDFFDKASHLPLAYFQQQSAGEFFTKFNSDISQAQRFFADFLPGVGRELITAVVVTVILFYFCPASLTLAALGIVGLTAILVTVLNHIMGFYARAQRDTWSDIQRVFDETIQGIDTVKVLAAEGQQAAHFHKHTTWLQKLSIRAGAILSVFSPGIELLTQLGGLGLVALAYYLIARGKMGLEPFLLFFFYATLLQMSVNQLTSLVATVQTEFTGMRHLAGFLAEVPEAEDSHPTVTLPSQSVPIELSNLTFGYPGGRRLYNQANLLIPANSVTVIGGESGSGKSTLINLLLRLYAPAEGVISIGGIDIRRISRTELRRKVGVVTQNHFIFQETLRGNLLIAQPDASDPQIFQALERAQLNNFLARLPEGIETVMDPRGVGASTGERQRICIARLLLRESPIMILDEPWSNLDDRARTLLAEVINACKSTATILILTHERHPALAVDRLYHLDGTQGILIQESH